MAILNLDSLKVGIVCNALETKYQSVIIILTGNIKETGETKTKIKWHNKPLEVEHGCILKSIVKNIMKITKQKKQLTLENVEDS